MAIVSSQDRAKLILTLESRIPAIQDPRLLDIFSLMLALLRDYQALEACVRNQKHVATGGAAALDEICTRIRQWM